MATSIRLSVILPVKNGANFLQEALNSLQENLSDLDEVICIDDDSTDQTCQILTHFQDLIPLKIFQRKSTTVADNRNFGIQNAQGKYITFIDHDDYWPKNRVQSHIDILTHNSEINVVRGKTSIVHHNLVKRKGNHPKEPVKTLHHVNLGAMTFRSEVFRSVGMFDETLKFSEDQDFFMRISDADIKILSINEVSLYYRIHTKNMTAQVPTSELMLTNVLLRSIKRKRN